MTVGYNPFDPAQVDDHYPALAVLRRDAPVSEVMPGVFYVSRYDDIVAVCRDHDTFGQGGFQPLDEDDRTPDQIQLGESNPPDHTVVRRILASALSPPQMRAYEPVVREVCEELVDGFARSDRADLIADLAAPLPAEVIGRLAGIEADERPKLRAYSDDLIASRSLPDPAEARAALDRVLEFDDHLREVIAARQAAVERPADLLTHLVDYVDDDGHRLSDEKILTTLSKDVIVGGIETTTHLVGNLFFDVLSQPGTYERIRADRGLVADAVEETMRHLPPVQVVFRRPAADVTLAGVTIPAGSTVVLGYASANRDAVFPDADRFDLDRTDARKHVGFGWGIDLCVGAPLARLEAAHSLGAAVDGIPSMRLAPGFEYHRVLFYMMRGPRRLDVEISRA